MFSTFTNSFVLVHHPSLPCIPAQIDGILQIPMKEIYFVICFFLKTMLADPFQQHPVLQISVAEVQFSSNFKNWELRFSPEN